MEKDFPKVLLIDADPQLGSGLKESLEKKKYQVDFEVRGDRALRLFKASKYDIIVLDAVLPGISGLDLAKEIRKTDSTTPILFISDKDDDKEKILAFCSGGDDYMVKPFTVTELVLRIYALLRRTRPSLVENESPGVISFGEFTFDYPNRMLCSPSDQMNLTKKESEVLRLLASNINNVVRREKVLTDVWGENDYFMGRSMDVYIARLRKKLARDKHISIVNVHRLGFKLEVSGNSAV